MSEPADEDAVLCETCGRTVPITEAVEQVYPDGEGMEAIAGQSWWACDACCGDAVPPA